MTEFPIRPGVLADLPRLRLIYRRSSLSNDGDGAALLAHPESLVLTDSALADGRTRVATLADDQIVGFVTTVRSDRVLEVEDLFVDPDWMRRGVARLLVSDAAAWGEAAMIERLEVTANPHAIRFYEKVGFIDDGSIETAFGPGRRMHINIAAPNRR